MLSSEFISENKYVVDDGVLRAVTEFDGLSVIRLVTGFNAVEDTFYGKVFRDDDLVADHGNPTQIHDPNVLIESVEETLSLFDVPLPEFTAEELAERLDDDAFHLAC